jgi:hypothetical protein
LAQRSRKRGRHRPPGDRPAASRPSTPVPPPAAEPRPGVRSEQSPPEHLPQPSRSEARNAEVRATLRPIAPGERPRAIVASSAIALGLALANLIAWLAGDTVHGRRPAAADIIVFSAVFAAAAVGMWRLWYGAVLGFMALLAIIAVIFTLLLIEASNVLGVVVALAIIGVSGYLFFKLVRVLSRIQMPRSPSSRP